MYITNGATDVIDVVIAIPGPGISISYYASYASVPGILITNGTAVVAGTVTLMPAPGIGNTNTLFGISVFNGSTNSATLTFRYNNAPSIQPVYVAILPPGFTLNYDGGPGPGGGEGWQIYNTSGTKQ